MAGIFKDNKLDSSSSEDGGGALGAGIELPEIDQDEFDAPGLANG